MPPPILCGGALEHLYVKHPKETPMAKYFVGTHESCAGRYILFPGVPIFLTATLTKAAHDHAKI